MTDAGIALTGADIFDGTRKYSDHGLLLRDGRVAAVLPVADLPPQVRRVALDGGLLVPGFVDLQVNGGGGVMLNDSPDLATLRIMAQAHARIGATTILPTLITDTPEHTRAAIEAVSEAVAAGVPGIAGLHLEGPHLALSRKGAHDPALIRPMTERDLAMLLDAAARLPRLKVTLAPESVTAAQIEVLADAGVLVSLGHTDASHAQCQAAVAAGARCVTHLFNAQSQMGNREPGVVGSALALGELSAGLIADTIHVHPACMSNALHAKRGPGHLFLVSDAMATAGSGIDHFFLNGRRINRDGDRLSLADGTLAGAHLELATAIRNVMIAGGLTAGEALAMATRIPADLIGATDRGRLSPGARADLVHLDADMHLRRVWQGGREVVQQE